MTNKSLIQPGKLEKPDKDDYWKVANAAKLQEILLTKVDFDVKQSYFDARSSERKLARSYKPTFSELDYDSAEGFASLNVQWNLDVKDGNRKLVKIHAKYVVLYSNLVEMDKGAVSYFMITLGRTSTYPYFRTLVSEFSWSSAIELPILPVITSRAADVGDL